MRRLDDTVLFVQADRRDVYFIRGQLDRVAEVGRFTDPLQFRFRDDAHRAVRSGAVDANDFPVTVRYPDKAQRIGRLERHLGGQPARQPFAPDRLGGLIDRIDPAIETRAHQAGDRRQALKGRYVGGAAANVGIQFGGDETRMRLDPIQHAWQQGLFQVAIAQPSDRGYRDRDQRNHRDGKPGCERHFGCGGPPFVPGNEPDETEQCYFALGAGSNTTGGPG